MDIWIIRGGEKSGPYPDYEIRRRIEEGELPADSPAWHEGLPAWTTLDHIEIFRGEFLVKPEPVEAPATIPVATPPPIPEKPKIGRRFWARIFDMHLYLAVWWIGLWATRADIEAILGNYILLITQFVPWFVIEIFLIHRFAATPGKWLLNLRVLNSDGSRLTLSQSSRRGLQVFLVGVGLGWPPVIYFCMALSAYTTRRIGSPIWDHSGKHRVVSGPLEAWRILATIFLLFIWLIAQIAVLMPYTSKQMIKENPEAKRILDKMIPWQLPSRHRQ